MTLSRVAATLLLALGAKSACAQAPPVNMVAATPRITTSGQPTAAWLEQLKANGFDAVIYLAPPTVSDAVREEPLIVARQGLVFVNVPVAFERPTHADFANFAGVLRGLADRRVLVHCQINLRGSSFVFLYRTIVGKEDPQRAWDAVTAVWVPEGTWRDFIASELQREGIAFDPF